MSFRPLLLLLLFVAAVVARAEGPVVAGSLVVLQGRSAAAPKQAPAAVKNAIWAVNRIVGKPYRWGGGHGTFNDVGYDCSGTISYLLHAAGLLDAPTTSRALQSWGEPGPGKWITIYARSGHVFAVVCGMRLDTTGRHDDEGPAWRDWYREPRGFVVRHPKGF